MKNNKLIYSLGLFLIITILFSGLCLAQKNPKDKFDFPKLNEIKMPKVKEQTLKNGLKVFLVEDNDYPTIDIRAAIRAGSVYEPADKIGLASITGMVLRTGGTRSMTGDEIDKKLETMAASIETGVGETSGSFSVSLLKEDIDKVLPILIDILTNPVFNEDKIELAKMQHKTSISRRNDDVSDIRSREFDKIIYGKDSPYARHTEYATIDAITQDDLIDYYKKYFHPNNTIITVWGDFKSKDMLKKLETAFGKWKKSTSAIPPVPEVKYEYKNTVNYIDKPDLNQTSILMGHIGGQFNNPDYPALIIMNQILSWERMFKKVRTDEGLAYQVFGYYGASYDHPGVFNSGAQTKSQSTVHAIKLMIKEVENMTQEEVADEELKRAKDQYLNSYVFNFDSKAEIVNRMMRYAYYGYPMDFADKVKQGVEKVTKADVLRVAQKYLKPDKLQILVVGNKQDFDEPLSTLGTVNEIDISIPQPKVETPAATPQTLKKGKEIFQKTISAMGDIEKIKNIKNFNVKFSATQNTPMGEMSMDANAMFVYPDKIAFKMSMDMGEIEMIINGDKSVMKHPGGTMPMPPEQKNSMLEGMLRDPIFIAQNIDDVKIQYVGETEFADQNAIDVLINFKDANYHMYLNPETMLPIGTSFQEMTQTGPALREEIVSDYRDVDGIKFSFKSIQTANGEKQGDVTIKEAQFNVDVDDSMFVVE